MHTDFACEVLLMRGVSGHTVGCLGEGGERSTLTTPSMSISCGPNPLVWVAARTANWLENGYLHLHPQVTDDFKFHSTKSVDSHEQSVCFGGEGEMGICCLGEISKNWFLPPPMGVPFCCNKYCYIGRGSLLNPIHCDYLPGWTVSGRHHSVAWQAKKQGELKKWLGHLFM